MNWYIDQAEKNGAFANRLFSVERVQEYIDAPQEAATQIPENRPAGDWPRYGSIEFIDYTTKYEHDLPPVLKTLKFQVTARDKIGIVGRTGAGKSSLALSLFRALESVGGQILIDGVDIKEIGLSTLRNAMTIVPQGKKIAQRDACGVESLQVFQTRVSSRALFERTLTRSSCSQMKSFLQRYVV